MKSFKVPPSSIDKDVQSLVEYVNDAKPYHSKLIEIYEESIFTERAKIRIVENLKIVEV